MISTLAAKPCTARASGRISTVQVRSQTSAAAPRTAEADKPVITRRHITIAAIVSGGALLYAQASSAVNAIEAKKRADERKERLKEAADKMRAKGVSQTAFADSKYAVSEDKTPNIHSRQEEGSKSQSNV